MIYCDYNKQIISLWWLNFPVIREIWFVLNRKWEVTARLSNRNLLENQKVLEFFYDKGLWLSPGLVFAVLFLCVSTLDLKIYVHLDYGKTQAISYKQNVVGDYYRPLLVS